MNHHNLNKKTAGQRKNRVPFFLAAAGAAAWWLSKEENQLKFHHCMQQATTLLTSRSFSSSNHFEVKNEKKPLSDKESNGKLVSEGVPFAVDYYNKKEQ